MSQFACIACHSVGRAKRRVPGSLLVELLVWVCGLLFFPVLILALAYSGWRLLGRGDLSCPVCRGAVVPLDTPAGRQILKSSTSLGRH